MGFIIQLDMVVVKHIWLLWLGTKIIIVDKGSESVFLMLVGTREKEMMKSPISIRLSLLFYLLLQNSSFFVCPSFISHYEEYFFINKNFQDSRPKVVHSPIVQLKTNVVKLNKCSHDMEKLSVASNMNNDDLQSTDHFSSSDLRIRENVAEVIS